MSRMKRLKTPVKRKINVSFQVLSMLLKLRQASCHPMLLKEDWKHGSSKMEKFLDELDQVLSRGSRVLVFSQFTSFLAIVQQELRARSIKNFYLDGQTPGMQRAELVERFQAERVFRLSYLTESGGQV